MICQIFKRRFFRPQTIAVILISVALMIISWLAGAMPQFKDYQTVLKGTHPFLDGFPWTYTMETAQRIKDDIATLYKSECLSFYVIMYHGFDIYFLIANIFIVLPFLQFFEERRSGYTKLMALKGKNQYFIAEAIADSIVAYLYVLIPLLIFWVIAVAIGNPLYPVLQDFNPEYDDFFQVSWQSGNIIWLYFGLIFLVSISYFLKGFFVFICSVFIEKKIFLVFIPVIYSYIIGILCIAIGLVSYGSFNYLVEDLKSLSPFLVNCFIQLSITAILFGIFFRREKVLNE